MNQWVSKIPSDTYFVRAIVVTVALTVRLVLVAWRSTCEVLEQRVVLVVSIAVFIEPSDAQVLEVTIADTGGCQCRVLDTIEVVDHVAAVLAAVEQTGQYEVNDSTDEQWVAASGNAVSVLVLEQGLQLGHVAGQTVEGELRNTVGLAVTRELVFVSSGRVNQRHLLNRNADGGDVVDDGTPSAAL